MRQTELSSISNMTIKHSFIHDIFVLYFPLGAFLNKHQSVKCKLEAFYIRKYPFTHFIKKNAKP
jgi:hypothetical protein